MRGDTFSYTWALMYTNLYKFTTVSESSVY